MKASEQKARAKRFTDFWKDKGYEKGESQKFWLSLLRDVYGVEHPEEYIEFEDKVHLDHTSFIDGFIPSTHVLIEQKSFGKNLNAPIKQSDGTLLSPFQQAKRYSAELPYDDRPRWIITCNFSEFQVYDMNKPQGEPERILLKDLPNEYYRLSFLVEAGNEHIKREMEMSFQAGELVGEIYDAFARQYKDITNEESQKSLNKLCVRLVFCLYAEDAGLFGKRSMFHDYMAQFDVRSSRKALIELFEVLDTLPENRDPYLDESLAQFPYVNGGLFADEHIEIPHFSEEIRSLLLENASDDFDWSEISPTIFGAVFESTLNPETRRKGGMHYTSIENIHKVIDPLFLDSLYEEFESIKELSGLRTRLKRLDDFQEKISNLTFFDPACGSGNFLTETYLSLRTLENEIIKLKNVSGQMELGFEGLENPIKVSIHQFYGIEINDFACTVAKTALWIAESQMMKKTEEIIHMDLEFLPLKSYTNVIEGNALRMDWNDVLCSEECSYIMGNPPFIGHQIRTNEQIKDMEIAFFDLDKHGKLDYVCAWYNKACEYMSGKSILCAFVSTNSICQGESVPILWKFLMEKKNLEIIFAHKSFIWNSEANEKAHVHCVIIGFSCIKINAKKKLFADGMINVVEHINGYLVDAADLYLESRGKPLCSGFDVMTKGSQPTDEGHLLLTKEERDELVSKYPITSNYIKEYIGAYEFINNKKRYCLWLKGVNPSDYRNIPEIKRRLSAVSLFRSKSPTKSVQKDALTPMLFTQIRQPDTDYLVIPETSSENRRYIPIGYLSKDVICSNSIKYIPNASLYIFGVMTSNVHMAWMRTVCGRLESRYRYSPAIYNNFPWANASNEQIARIEKTAQAILDARALYPDSSLADLYDEITMPPELRKAHQENDRAVMQAYGFDIKTTTESSCVAGLMKMYQSLIKE